MIATQIHGGKNGSEEHAYVTDENQVQGCLGGTAVKASAFGSGRDPGVLGSSPTSGSSTRSLLLPLPLPLLVFPLSLAVSISVE